MSELGPWPGYGLLLLIGVLGAVGDGLIYRAATAEAPARPLAGGFAVWLLALAAVFVYFRLGRHGFTVAVVVMIVVHGVVSALADVWFFGGHVGRREALGLALAAAALVALESGADRADPPAPAAEVRP